MEGAGLVAIILICGLYADNILTKDKLKKLTERVEDLEKAKSSD